MKKKTINSFDSENFQYFYKQMQKHSNILFPSHLTFFLPPCPFRYRWV